MAPFQYAAPTPRFAATIAEMIAHASDPQAQAAERIAQAQAQATQQGAAAWGGAVQQIGQSVGAIPQQIQQARTQQLQQQKDRAQIADIQAQQQQREAAARKQHGIEQQQQTVDRIMQTSMKTDPETGVASFDRPAFETALVQSGSGHLYPQLAETLDKLDASASKRSAEARSMLAHVLDSVEKAGYTPAALLTGAAYLKANNVATAQHLEPVFSVLADDQSPETVKGIVDKLGAGLPEYQALKDANAKRAGDMARQSAETGKLAAETAKTQAEVAGTLPPTPAQADTAHARDIAQTETARHNAELERIAALGAGRQDAAQRETARHNAAMEGQGEAALGGLTPEALKLTAHQYAMTGQLPPMGMGKAGAAIRTQIINTAADAYKNLDLPTQVAAYKANQASLTKLQGTADKVSAFESTAGKNLDQFLSLAEKIPDTGVPWVNMPVRVLNDRLVGSANQAAANAARDVALREITRVTNDPNLSGVLSDHARAEVSGLSPKDATFNQIKDVAKVLKQDMANVHGSLNDQISAIQQRIATPPSGVAPPAPAAQPSVGERRLINGKVGEWDGKGWKAVP